MLEPQAVTHRDANLGMEAHARHCGKARATR